MKLSNVNLCSMDPPVNVILSESCVTGTGWTFPIIAEMLLLLFLEASKSPDLATVTAVSAGIGEPPLLQDAAILSDGAAIA